MVSLSWEIGLLVVIRMFHHKSCCCFSQLLQLLVTEADILYPAFSPLVFPDLANIHSWMLCVVTLSLGIVSALLQVLSCLFIPHCPKLYLHESFELLAGTGTLPENTSPIMQQKRLVCGFSLI